MTKTVRAVWLVLALTAVAVTAATWRPAIDRHLPMLVAEPANAATQLWARFYGTTTVAIGDGRHTILIDGFFSRPRLRDGLAPAPNDERVRQGLQTVGPPSAIFVAHAHHDHVLDTAAVAQRWGAVPIYGSDSVRTAIARLAPGVNVSGLSAGSPVPVGGFIVTPIPTPHSRMTLIERVFSPLRRFDDGNGRPAFWEYDAVDNFSFLITRGNARILVVPSASDGARFPGVTADMVFLSIARLGRESPRFSQRYWCEAVRATKARLVVPIHWDDMMGEPTQPLPYLFDNVRTGLRRIQDAAAADGVALRRMPLVDLVSVEAAWSPLPAPRPRDPVVCDLPPYVDANGDHGISVDELQRVTSPQAAQRVLTACDAAPQDAVLRSDAEVACLKTQTAGPGTALSVESYAGVPLFVPQPGWRLLLLMGAGLLILTGVLTGRAIRAWGWRRHKVTGGAWFRQGALTQWLVALIVGAALAATAALGLRLHLEGLVWSRVYFTANGMMHLVLGAATLVTATAAALLMIAKSRQLRELMTPLGTPGPVTPARTHPKNIIVCCDGTGNKSGSTVDGKSTASNVEKLYQLLVPADQCGWLQSLWYDDGVGTGTSEASRRLSGFARVVDTARAKTPTVLLGVFAKLRTVKELAVGVGITENVAQGYREIVRQYEPGDRIFLFGFSRGAYTARCIADVIDDIGLLRPEFIRHAADVIQCYRYRSSTTATVRLDPRLLQPKPEIHFLGLFDTVASLGVPLWGWSYSIAKLYSNKGMGPTAVQCCRTIRHALAIDEERSQFIPTLFDERTAEGCAAHPDLEQRWFRGAHSGVGGGYTDRSLSDISLQWMAEEAEKAGLLLTPDWRHELRRNSIGLMITQLERQRAWRLVGTWPRWHPCTPDAPSAGFGVLDGSVMARARHSRSLRTASGPVGSDELLRLAAGETATVRVRASYTWHRTGVVMEQGARYRITYAGGTWRDKQAPLCGPAGQSPTGTDLRRLLGSGLRYSGGAWMELIGHVAHPREWPQQELGGRDLFRHVFRADPVELTQTLIPLGRHLPHVGDSVVVENQALAGMFYAFANDWWLFYDNNTGVVTLTVTRLADDDPTQPEFVVNRRGVVE